MAAEQAASAALARNDRRRSELKTIAVAIELLTADSEGSVVPRPLLGGELNAPSRPGGIGLVGKYLQSTIRPASPQEQYCYWYSTAGQSAFVGAWLEVENAVAVEKAVAHEPSSSPGPSVSDFTRLLAGASASDFRLGQPCRSPAGFVGVGL